jgi:Peptidase family M1 domain
MMNGRFVRAAVSGLTLSALAVVPAGAATVPGSSPSHCTSGAHTLSHFGDHVYPETGNGGYRSLHTDVHMIYDAKANQFLPGNHVDLSVRAMQCLTDFSLDFERASVDKADGPKMEVGSVLIDGVSAAYTFVQPTYPGDPNGQDDPDPRAHQAGQVNPVGGKDHNPLPPACTPAVTGNDVNAQNGDPCPANKLVITPPANIKPGTLFKITVFYTGRPGVHTDGDGTTEGWFRNNTPPGDGGFVTTEPVGTEDWMPLNNHPSAKPTYDFYDTVTAGRTAIANGILVSSGHNPPDALFRDGSTTFHWHSPAPIANYLVENSVGNYDLTFRDADDGIRYYEAQAGAIDDAQKQANLAIMDQQQDITDFQSQFNGPFPFTSNGVLVGIPQAGFEEEMQTMITFQGGSIGLRTFHHENMHQWWGDSVSEGNYNLTFFKEGMARFGEYLFNARNAANTAGGMGTPAGDAAFDASLVNQFNANYANTGSMWVSAPSDPTPARLFTSATTYNRPATAYIALRQILGKDNLTAAMKQIQRDYRFSSITETQLEAEFHAFMPDQSAACSARLDQFFAQWFDTVYPTGGGANRPQLTGPGLTGPGFYNADGTCG